MTLPPEIVYYFRIFVRKYYFIAFGNCDFAIIKITGRVKTLPYGESDSSSINSQFYSIIHLICRQCKNLSGKTCSDKKFLYEVIRYFYYRKGL